jgi:hypothetical protein
MKTAVEWLIDKWVELDSKFDSMLIDRVTYCEQLCDIHKQAKEMEKEQKIDFARLCLNKAKDLDILTSFMNAEQYYNKTFKSE